MARTAQDVTDAELAVLQVLWEQGPATIRQITDSLYPGGRPSHYATVQKLLDRLEGKECVRRDRAPAVHVFAAAIDRDHLIGRRLRTLAEQLCGGSLTPVLTHLVQNRQLTVQERRELRALLEHLDRRPRDEGR